MSRRYSCQLLFVVDGLQVLAWLCGCRWLHVNDLVVQWCSSPVLRNRKPIASSIFLLFSYITNSDPWNKRERISSRSICILLWLKSELNWTFASSKHKECSSKEFRRAVQSPLGLFTVHPASPLCETLSVAQVSCNHLAGCGLKIHHSKGNLQEGKPRATRNKIIFFLPLSQLWFSWDAPALTKPLVCFKMLFLCRPAWT